MVQWLTIAIVSELLKDSEKTIHSTEINDTLYERAAFSEEMKQKKNSKWPTQKIQNGRLKKTSFSSSANSQYFFMKFSWLSPWVNRID